MIGLPVEFAYIKPGDDLYLLGVRYCKITPHHGESLVEGKRCLIEPTTTVVHATNLPLFTADDLLTAQRLDLSPAMETALGYATI